MDDVTIGEEEEERGGDVVGYEGSYYGLRRAIIDWNGDDGVWGGCWGMVMSLLVGVGYGFGVWDL